MSNLERRSWNELISVAMDCSRRNEGPRNWNEGVGNWFQHVSKVTNGEQRRGRFTVVPVPGCRNFPVFQDSGTSPGVLSA